MKWRDWTNSERVLWTFETAERLADLTGDNDYKWLPTGFFYDLEIYLFRNVISILGSEGYAFDRERIKGFRLDGRPRAWYRYRLIRTPDGAITETPGIVPVSCMKGEGIE